MRYAHLLIMALFCLNFTIIAQNPILNKTISGSYNQIPVSFLLKDIQKRYEINFYYANNLPSLNKVISLDFKNKTLEQVLFEIFNNSEIDYEIVGSQIVLKKRKDKPKVPKTSVYKSSGSIQSVNYVLQDSVKLNRQDSIEQTENFKADSVYVVTDQIGYQDSVVDPASLKYYTIKAKSKKELNLEYLEARKKLREQYRTLSDSLKYEELPAENRLKASISEVLLRLKTEIDRISDSLSTHLTKEKVIKDSLISKEGLEYRPAQITFISPLGTNGTLSHRSVNKISLNILGGNAAGLEGVEFGTLYNIDDVYMHGTQFSGLINHVNGDMTGAQFAGLINTAYGPTNGGQFSGLLSIAGDSMKGYQAAGLMNLVNGGLKGGQTAGFMNIVNGEQVGSQVAGFMNVISDSAHTAQFAGFLNVSKKVKGFQGAGFLNIANGDLNGTQVSGFLNIAKNVTGAQIGIINIADSVSGIQIGFLSLAKKGYRRFEIYSSESMQGNVGFKIGNQKFYNIFSLSGNFVSQKNYRWALGYGLGTELNLGSKILLNMDLMSHQINENDLWTHQYLNLLNQFKMGIGLKLKTIVLFAGPTWNVMVSQKTNSEGIVTGSDIGFEGFYNQTSGKTNVKMWPGFNIGIRL